MTPTPSPAPAAAGEGTERPGGWVDGIGWVALLADLNGDDLAAVHPGGQSCRAGGVWASSAHPVVVVRWADGTTPAPPAPSTPAPQADRVVVDQPTRTIALYSGSDCTAFRLDDWTLICPPHTSPLQADLLLEAALAATPPSTPAEPEQADG